MGSFWKRAFRSFSVARLAIACFFASGLEARADDYVRDKAPSPAAKAYFSAVPQGLPQKTLVRGDIREADENGAYFTEDGSISIPPKAMIVFTLAGKCMDPHLPAPGAGEPMQFVDASKLVPRRLRTMYDNLVRRQAQGDPSVLANNPQHLVWAIRTAGTDDPLANNLSASQLDVLDECAGRRGTFMNFHEREKRRNAKKGGRRDRGNRVSVGDFSYDASELRGTNAVQVVERHVSTLAEMTRKATAKTSAEFRFGEIEEDLYSDVSCDGGLSFSARILNASEHRKEFRASDFVAQVGNGSQAGSQRQRVTMGYPDKFTVIEGAAVEGVEIDRNESYEEADGEIWRRVRGRSRSRRTVRYGEGCPSFAIETEPTRRTRTETTEIVLVPSSVPPVEPVDPVVIVETNTLVRDVPVAEKASIRVRSLEYDEGTGRGILAVEIAGGSFSQAMERIRNSFPEWVRAEAGRLAPDVTVPDDADLEPEEIRIRENNLCEVLFSATRKE